MSPVGGTNLSSVHMGNLSRGYPGWSVHRGSYGGGGGGGVSGTVHGPKKQRITNHGYQNFTFPNHENQHVKHFYLVSV